MLSFVRSKIATIVFSVIALWMVALAVAAIVRKHEAVAELSAIENRIEDIERDNERLRKQLERMRQPEWLALLARKNLNYKTPDETTVIVYKEEKVATIAQSQAPQKDIPRWRLWWRWLMGN